MLNWQVPSITGMYPSTPLHPLLSEAVLTPARITLDTRQRLYGYWLISFPDEHPAKKILPISLRTRDGIFQPKELPENNLMWTQNVWRNRLTKYTFRLSRTKLKSRYLCGSMSALYPSARISSSRS